MTTNVNNCASKEHVSIEYLNLKYIYEQSHNKSFINKIYIKTNHKK